MDTIFVANETLKHLIDSVHVLMPDSIKTFQSPEAKVIWSLTSKDLIQISVSTVGIIISIIALWNSNRANELNIERQNFKEQIRINNLKEHNIVWLKIIRNQILNQAFLLRSTEFVERYISFRPKFELITKYDFSFEKILELSKIELTEIYILQTIDRDVNSKKLDMLISLARDTKEFKNSINVSSKEYQDKYINKVNDVSIFLNQWTTTLLTTKFQELRETIIKFDSEFKAGYAYHKNGINDIIKTIKETELKDLEIYNGKNSNMYYNLIQYLEELISINKELRTTHKSLEFKFLKCAHKLNCLYEYYNGKISDAEFNDEISGWLKDDTFECIKKLYQTAGIGIHDL